MFRSRDTEGYFRQKDPSVKRKEEANKKEVGGIVVHEAGPVVTLQQGIECADRQDHFTKVYPTLRCVFICFPEFSDF